MAKGTLKAFYGFTVGLSTAGGGHDGSLVLGGYLKDPSVLGGDNYPVLPNQISSMSAAVSAATAFARRFQSDNRDVGASIYFRVYGNPATTPIRALPSDIAGDSIEVARVDPPGKYYTVHINLANREEVTEYIPTSDAPQDLEGGSNVG